MESSELNHWLHFNAGSFCHPLHRYLVRENESIWQETSRS